MSVEIRKITIVLEEVLREAGEPVSPPTRRAAAIAVIRNPFAGRYEKDLSELIDQGAELGGILTARCIEALAIEPSQAESYGKAALVGEDGELEHAAALLHPAMGKPVRDALGGGAALIPSSKARGPMGMAFDVPLGHRHAAFVRSHFDGMVVKVSDAPRANEIVVAVAVTDSGRPHPRIGGLVKEDVVGKDGLR